MPPNEEIRTPPIPPKMTPEDAIFEIWQKTIRIETVILGVPGTDDKGLVGKVNDNCDDLDATRKKVGHLEIRFWLLVGLLAGSGVLGGFGLAKLVS